MKISPELLRKAQELIAARREAAAAPMPVAAVAAPSPVAVVSSMLAEERAKELTDGVITTALGKRIGYNERQQQAISYALQGKSFCLIGAAGTGKTTTQNGAMQALLASGIITPLATSTKYLRKGAPGIVAIAYTRRAVRQIARNVPKEVTALTAHKLLEFEPVFYEVVDPDGTVRKTMRFEPMRHGNNPLPTEIRTIVIDESSMFSVELYDMLLAAILHGVQIILLGDLHQIPPVYGTSILAAKLTEWPVVELTEVYRQALESPIIQLATAIRTGEGWPVTAKTSWTSPDGKSRVTIQPWLQQLRGYDDGTPSRLPTAIDGFKGFCDALIRNGDYNEEEDIILMPFNKSCGTVELNKHIANTLGKRRGAVVHHVIAGYNNHYFAVGDRVLYEKNDAIIVRIEKNPAYYGKAPNKEAVSLTRWGHYEDDADREANGEYDAMRDLNIDGLLAQLALVSEDDGKFNQTSHIITLVSADNYEAWKQDGLGELVVKETGAINAMIFAYALTIHKAQGSEWRRVFLFLHSSHHNMCSRELIYTAITRAREELYIICEPDRGQRAGTLTRAAKNPRIKGDTLEEKITWLRAQQATRELEELS